MNPISIVINGYRNLCLTPVDAYTGASGLNGIKPDNRYYTVACVINSQTIKISNKISKNVYRSQGYDHDSTQTDMVATTAIDVDL